jgi:hypothetical protein
MLTGGHEDDFGFLSSIKYHVMPSLSHTWACGTLFNGFLYLMGWGGLGIKQIRVGVG